MKETINSIQTKLDHLYNRTQVNGGKVKASEMLFVVFIFVSFHVNICLFRFTTRLWSALITTW